MPPELRPFKRLNIQDYKKMLSQHLTTTIDIRDAASFSSAHIPHALHIQDLDMSVFIRTYDKKEPLVICCYHGHSSQQAAAYFVEQGFEDVYSLDGGYAAWTC